MQLTRYTDYALRTVLFLGSVKRMATITEVSERYGISRNHLVKVVHRLGQLGTIETLRGKSGGILLVKDPASVNVGELIRNLEPNLHLVECFNEETNACPITPACLLQSVLGEAQDAFFRVLDRYTLADFLKNKDDLLRLLPMTPTK